MKRFGMLRLLNSNISYKTYKTPYFTLGVGYVGILLEILETVLVGVFQNFNRFENMGVNTSVYCVEKVCKSI